MPLDEQGEGRFGRGGPGSELLEEFSVGQATERTGGEQRLEWPDDRLTS